MKAQSRFFVLCIKQMSKLDAFLRNEEQMATEEKALAYGLH